MLSRVSFAPYLPMRLLRSTGVRGASWTTIGFGVSYAIRLISTLALTRLLTPDVFGLMSLAGVFLTALAMISDIGTIPSVIRSSRGDERDFLDTAWSLQAVRGVWLGGLLVLLAWPISQIYDEPMLFPVLCAMAITPVLQGLTTISVATCRRHVKLARLTILGTAGQITITLLNIFFAWLLQSVWALILGSIIGTLLTVIAGYIWLPAYRPRLKFDRSVMSEIVTFGRWILLGTLFTYLGGQGSRAVMGFEVDLDTLGLITIATTIAWALGELVGKILSQVAFPSMSRAYREGRSLSDIVARVKKMIFFGVFPGFILLHFLSHEIIDLLYDSRYSAAGDFLQFFALNGAIATLAMPYQNAMLASGDSRGHSIVMGASAALRLGLMLAGAHFFGIYGLIAGLGLGELFTLGVSLALNRKLGTSKLGYDVFSVVVVLILYGYSLSTGSFF